MAGLFAEPKKEDISGTLLVEGQVEPYLLVGPLKRKIHQLFDNAH